MINAPNTLSSKDKKLRKQKSASSRESERHHPFHEILNELTVINLCCGKFRVVAEQSRHTSLLVDIERMEHAVIEMTSLLEKISESIKFLRPLRAPPRFPNEGNLVQRRRRRATCIPYSS